MPKRPLYRTWVEYAPALKQLHIARLLERLLLKDANLEAPISFLSSEGAEVALEVFADLNRISNARDSMVALVFLPTSFDYRSGVNDAWRRHLRSVADEKNWIFIDLIEDFSRLPPREAKKLFIRLGEIDYLRAEGHYTERGNRHIATNLYQKLMSIQRFAEKMAR